MDYKRAILAVSFGTSCKSAMAAIEAAEKSFGAAFEDYEVRRAFTSERIIAKLEARDGMETDNVPRALEKLAGEGYSDIVVQPTYIINGYEYELMREQVYGYRDRFETMCIGTPLLTYDSDYERLAEVMAEAAPQLTDDGTAAVFVGHGTEHCANSAYAALAYRLNARGHKNCFVGTVEAFPDIEDVKSRLRISGAKRVILKPLLMVAGEHALNDICGSGEGSWLTELEAEGYEVICERRGLGEYEGVRAIFADHIRMAIGDHKSNG